MRRIDVDSWLIAAIVLFLLIGLYLAATPVRAQGLFTPDDTEAAITQYSAEYGVSYAWLERTISCETGGTFSNYKVGAQGEQGAAQLHPYGELPVFYAWGYDDPHDPYQSIRFTAQRFATGHAWAWTCS
jgi:hypothetical protein